MTEIDLSILFLFSLVQSKISTILLPCNRLLPKIFACVAIWIETGMQA